VFVIARKEELGFCTPPEFRLPGQVTFELVDFDHIPLMPPVYSVAICVGGDLPAEATKHTLSCCEVNRHEISLGVSG
jgi:hypothetical protein